MSRFFFTHKVEVMIEEESGFRTVVDRITISRAVSRIGTVNLEWEKTMVTKKAMAKYHGFVGITFL